MPKKIGTAYRRQLRATSNLWERMLLCTYGRLFPADAVLLVALVSGSDDIEKRVRLLRSRGWRDDSMGTHHCGLCKALP